MGCIQGAHIGTTGGVPETRLERIFLNLLEKQHMSTFFHIYINISKRVVSKNDSFFRPIGLGLHVKFCEQVLKA